MGDHRRQFQHGVLHARDLSRLACPLRRNPARATAGAYPARRSCPHAFELDDRTVGTGSSRRTGNCRAWHNDTYRRALAQAGAASRPADRIGSLGANGRLSGPSYPASRMARTSLPDSCCCSATALVDRLHCRACLSRLELSRARRAEFSRQRFGVV